MIDGRTVNILDNKLAFGLSVLKPTTRRSDKKRSASPPFPLTTTPPTQTTLLYTHH